MGIFKDGFKAVKGAKELGDYHGGMPSISGSFKDIAALYRRPGPGRDPASTASPTKARGQGLPRCRSTRSRWASSSTCSRPSGGDPYKVQYMFPTARMKAPLSIGMEVPVKVMADDPNAVAVQWDALKGSIAASGGDMAVAMQGIQNMLRGHRRRRGPRVPRRQGGGRRSRPKAAPTIPPSGSRS